MTPEERELCARFEAHLRGWEMTRLSNWLQPPGENNLPRHATPPDTADGREWWAERLLMTTGPVEVDEAPTGEWAARTGYGNGWFIGDSRSEAITAAIVAAAKAWAGARKAGAK